MRHESEEYRRKRKTAIKRDRASCITCGWSEVDSVSRQLHVHHVVPRRLFDSVDVADQPVNLTTLCSMCHGEWESSFRAVETISAGAQDEYCQKILSWMEHREEFYSEAVPDILRKFREQSKRRDW